ncbi:SLOG family protein [Candidatus Soleaferrea massiliensis]|uniref:SLOG family protein n=1 Tax=Candidatus Soleaferrea massiliensis TaxID=1470354 RepID=UPI00058F660F|nr:SLOG family protein [Candidatus Soleaferrea massiliensis]
MKERTCCFTGHRDLSACKVSALQRSLRMEIIKLIEKGVWYFGSGGACGFDQLAALTVLDLKKTYSYIRLILILPCRNQEKFWNTDDAAMYKTICDQADKIVYTSDHYYTGCMHKRNRYLVDHSDCCICYLTQQSGGTKYTVDYALKKNVRVIHLNV